MSNVPQFEAEFERKLIDAIARSRSKFERGEIASHAYQHTLEAINDIARGLCDETISLALDQERDIAGYADDVDTTVWKQSSVVVVVTKQRTGDKVRVITDKGGKIEDKVVKFTHQEVPSEAATGWANKLKVGMIKNGFERVL